MRIFVSGVYHALNPSIKLDIVVIRLVGDIVVGINMFRRPVLFSQQILRQNLIDVLMVLCSLCFYIRKTHVY